MNEIEEKNFKCIKEDNSDEENEKQWKISRIVFEHFYEYLKNKGLKKGDVNKQTDKVIFFVMEYLFVYDNANSILEVSDITIRKFLGNWYIRKVWGPDISTMRDYLTAISNFYEFLFEKGFISQERLNKIQEVCKDVDWFEMRLRTYRTAIGKDFEKWIEEYDYEWF